MPRKVNTTGFPYGTRDYYRVTKQRERDRKLAVRNRTAAVCQWSIGHGLVCGARLVDVVDKLGRVQTSCPACARRKAGLCRDCPRPRLPGTTAMRCEACARRQEKRLGKKRQRLDIESGRNAEVKRRWRRRKGVKPAKRLTHLTPEQRLAHDRLRDRKRKERQRRQAGIPARPLAKERARAA